ncbi:hypothetical protein OQA88_12147 [Cercophora sp. LCS_1]
MAPWPGRVDSNRPTDGLANQQQTSSRRPHAGSSSARHSNNTLRTQEPQFEVLDSYQIQAGSSSSDEGLHPKLPPRPRHGRSMSHPFPSLFSSKKKKAEQMTAEHSDSESGDEAGPMPRLSKQPTRGHRNVSSTGSRDYSTGRCMTCGSLVRWPRELQIFKCTICLTINNLQPPERQFRRDASQLPNAEERSRPGRPRAVSPAGHSVTRRVSERPISVEHAKLLGEQCLRSFLGSALGGRAGRRPSSDRRALTGGGPSQRSPSGGRTAGYQTRKSLSVRPAGAGTPESPPQHGSPPDSHRYASSRQTNASSRSYSMSHPEGRPRIEIGMHEPRPGQSPDPPSQEAEGKRLFRPLEDYVIDCFTSFDSLNSSFMTHQPNHRVKPSRDAGSRRPPESRPPEPRKDMSHHPEYPMIDLDPKLLLLGDFAENGSWWTGGQEELLPGRSASSRSENSHSIVSTRSPHIDWVAVDELYLAIVEAGRSWPDVYSKMVDEDSSLAVPPTALEEIESQILYGQDHLQKALLKACETIMKRPGRPLSGPDELRFLLIIAANPLLHGSYKPYTGQFDHIDTPPPDHAHASSRGAGPVGGRHSGIIKRIVGLLSNTSHDCHSHLVHWFARYPDSRFRQFKELVSGFLAYRLIRQNEKKLEVRVDITDGLIPSMSAGQSQASLHAVLGQGSGPNKRQKEKQKKIIYQDDWQIRAAAQVLGFLFAANNMGHGRRDTTSSGPVEPNSRERVQARGQVVATSDFYVTLLDDSDLVADYEAWEAKKGKFSFCQFSFLLSVGAKIRILEYDARRQMQNRARTAFFDSLASHRIVQQHLVINVRRDCLVDDSLKAVSEVIGGGAEDIKKGLKIIFRGEEGVDAGGLKKEWFLLLVREVFNPDYGMFIYDEDSQYCYFNPNSLEPSEQFFLVGVLFGLAIHNSTILDVAFPPFAFRKLLMAAPPAAATTSQPRQAMTYTLDDLAEYRPRLAQGLRHLLDYEGEVEETYGFDFSIDTNRYGVTEQVLLLPAGDHRPVTNANRKEYVDLYVRYLLDTSVARQFEPFKRGFFTVCGGNALSLFRPEEIELLVRGSEEALDINSLKAVAEYDNWGVTNPAETEPIIKWFWESFEKADPADQRKLLLFITGSDRIPAMGAASLTIRISCLGDDVGRFPSARTCFNTLALWRYGTKEKLEEMLWRAVGESEGFGLK